MNLNGKWTLYYAIQGSAKIEDVLSLKTGTTPRVEATVPGNVELDLSRAGILPEDLFKGMNILEAEKYEQYEWWYEKTFTAPSGIEPDEEAVLNFRAVDCYAEYYLNGEKIGESDNMFIAHPFDVTDKLRYGKDNTVHVHIRSATIEATRYLKEPHQLAYTWSMNSESAHIRKAPHSYGWDIMPRAISAGIWRDVSLDIRKKYDFRYVYIHTLRMTGNNAEMVMIYDSLLPTHLTSKKLNGIVHVKSGDSEVTHTFRGKSAGTTAFTIPNAKLWWPKPYGEPNLYDAEVTIFNEDDSILLTKALRFGVRTLELRHSDLVEPGGAFEFVVNGTRIMAVGSNWVPMDAYHSRDALRYARALEMAEDLGCNILRCWGGNVYEDHAFFDFCDEHGIMVWQDFAMACNYYPQTEDFIRRLEKEAQWVISEYRQHPSIVVWAGDNEVDSMLACGHQVDPSYNRLNREILPRIAHRFDPYRPFLASSPYISPKAFASGDNRQGSATYPEDHMWGPRDYFKSNFYQNSNAYFVSEIGYHGCPAKKSIEKFIDPEYVWPYQNNEQWNLHSSDQNNWDYRTMLMHNQVKQLFGTVPTDMDDYILASQISQAEAKKFFIEHMRAKMARNGGVIWWNLIDGWPQMSDAIVDYYYEKKLAYDYIKRSQRDFMIMLNEMDSWGQDILCANSTLHPVSGSVTITDMDTDDVVFETAFTAAPNSNTVLGKLPLMYSDQGMFLIRWTLDNGETHFNTYLYGAPRFDLQQYKRWLQKLPDSAN